MNKAKMNTRNIFSFIFLFSFIILFFLISLTDNVLAEQFNIDITIPETYRNMQPGTDMWFTTNVVNLGNTDRMDIVLKSEIIDASGAIIASKTKTVAMETSASFVNDIFVKENVPNGKYYLVVSIELPDRTIESREEFFVGEKNNSQFVIALLIGGVVLLIIIIVSLLIVYKKHLEIWKMRLKIHNIVRSKLKKKK